MLDYPTYLYGNVFCVFLSGRALNLVKTFCSFEKCSSTRFLRSFSVQEAARTSSYCMCRYVPCLYGDIIDRIWFKISCRQRVDWTCRKTRTCLSARKEIEPVLLKTIALCPSARDNQEESARSYHHILTVVVVLGSVCSRESNHHRDTGADLIFTSHSLLGVCVVNEKLFYGQYKACLSDTPINAHFGWLAL